MRPSRISLPLTTAAYSTPILHDRMQVPVNIGLAVTFSEDTAGSPSVNVVYSLDEYNPRYVESISRSSTTITVTGDFGQPASGAANSGDGGAHGLSANDFVQITGTGVLDGWYNVQSGSLSTTSYTLTSPNSGTVSAIFGAQVSTFRIFTHGSLATLATRATGNYAYPVTLSALQVASTGSAGIVVLQVLQGEQG